MRLSQYQRGNVLVIGLVAVVVVAVVVGFVFLSPEPESTSPDRNSSSSQDNTSYPDLTQDIPELPSATSIHKPQQEAAVVAGRPGSEARAIISRFRTAEHRPDMHDIHVRGVGFKNQGKPVDAYLLWFFAARDGHVPSALILGEMYDPEYFVGANEVMEQPDPAQAYKWYLRAAEGGDPTADDRLAVLHSAVEQAAATGDDDAKRLLLRWQ